MLPIPKNKALQEVVKPKLLSILEKGIFPNIDEFKTILSSEDENVNVRREDGLTLLHLSIINKKDDVAELLLKKGAKTDIADNKGWTALHYASCFGRFAPINLLLTYGANPRLKTRTTKSFYGREEPDYYQRYFNKDSISIAVDNFDTDSLLAFKIDLKTIAKIISKKDELDRYKINVPEKNYSETLNLDQF